jgi:hypothetical protein
VGLVLAFPLEMAAEVVIPVDGWMKRTAQILPRLPLYAPLDALALGVTDSQENPASVIPPEDHGLGVVCSPKASSLWVVGKVEAALKVVAEAAVSSYHQFCSTCRADSVDPPWEEVRSQAQMLVSPRLQQSLSMAGLRKSQWHQKGRDQKMEKRRGVGHPVQETHYH